jgi:hypothetical protein
MAAALLLVLLLHLLPALLVGLATYELVRLLVRFLKIVKIHHIRAKLAAVGLVAYLSGDTGITAEQELVVRRHYGANLVVMNVGGAPNMTGPSEAAFVVNELVRPNSVIVTHVNEAATVDGELVPTSKTAAFHKAVKVPVHVPLSGRTMEFDGSGRCALGC